MCERLKEGQASLLCLYQIDCTRHVVRSLYLNGDVNRSMKFSCSRQLGGPFRLRVLGLTVSGSAQSASDWMTMGKES